MAFQFVCPHCHHKTNVDNKYAGQTGPCVSCGRTVTMPDFNEQGVLVRPLRSQATSPKELSNKRTIHWAPIMISLSSIVLLLLIGGIAFTLAYPSLRSKASMAAQRMDSDNLLSISKALNAYCDRYGTYPPPYVADQNGKPLYSWRVLILPFMGYEDLYRQFQLDQAHNSPANLSLLHRMPREFASRLTSAKSGAQTNYVLLTGPGTLFPTTGPLSRHNIEDPTILLVETVEGNATWTEPVDIDVSKGLVIGKRSCKDMGGIHYDSTLIVTTKEEVYSLKYNIPNTTIDALVSPNGGEKIDMRELTQL